MDLKDKDSPMAFINLPPEMFPVRLEAFRADTKEIVWFATVDQPKGDALSPLYIPPLAKIHGCRIGIRIKYADGVTTEHV